MYVRADEYVGANLFVWVRIFEYVQMYLLLVAAGGTSLTMKSARSLRFQFLSSPVSLFLFYPTAVL